MVSKSFWNTTIWDVSSWELVKSYEIPSSSGAISTVSQSLAAGTHDIKLWDISNPKQMEDLYVLPPKFGVEALSHSDVDQSINHSDLALSHHIDSVNQNYRHLEFSNNGQWIAAGGSILDSTTNKWHKRVKIWDLDRKVQFKVLERKTPKDLETVTNNGKRTYMVPTDKGIRRIEIKNPNVVSIRSIKFSVHDRYFIIGTENGLTIWSLPDWKIYHELHDVYVRDIAFSPNGTIFAIATTGGIMIWLIEEKTPIAVLRNKGFSSSVSVLAFSSDGNTLAGGGFDGVLSLWDMSEIE